MGDLTEQVASIICAACPDLSVTVFPDKENEYCSSYRRGLKSYIVPCGKKFKYVIYSRHGPIIIGIEGNAIAALKRAFDLMEEAA
jgi:hypothetical protein